jgi:predicted ferric reductase
MNLLLLKILDNDITDEISILSYFFNLDEEIIIEEVYPIHLYSTIISMLLALIHPFLLRNPKASSYCLQMQQQALKLLSAQIIEM